MLVLQTNTGGLELFSDVKNFEIIILFRKLPNYPSFKSTLTLASHLEKNVGLGEG